MESTTATLEFNKMTIKISAVDVKETAISIVSGRYKNPATYLLFIDPVTNSI